MRTPLSSPPPFFGPHFDRVGLALQEFLPADSTEVVVDCMRYTLLAPSKRVRAVLVLLTAELCGNVSRAMPAACAIEAVHAASLMLDDLPCMDNAPLRRGRPSSHLTYGEAVTILAAFGLLNQAFGHLAKSYEPPLAMRLTSLMSGAVGLDGLVGGQAEDVLATERALSFETLERIHRRKTGVFFSAAAAAGVLTAGGSSADLERAHQLREEPRARVPDRRRSARRHGHDGRDGQGRAHRRAQDDVRVVQRRGRRAPARRASCAPPPRPRSSRSAPGPTHWWSWRSSSPRGGCKWPAGRISESTSCASSCARSAISTRASIASCSAGPRGAARRSRSRRPRAFASACSPARCWARGRDRTARAIAGTGHQHDRCRRPRRLPRAPVWSRRRLVRVHLDSHRRSGRSPADAHAGVRRARAARRGDRGSARDDGVPGVPDALVASGARDGRRRADWARRPRRSPWPSRSACCSGTA